MDPYEILGISRNANAEEIKKAYRREAMKWHPDRSGNTDEAKERFYRAAEAYRQLSGNGTGRPGEAGSTFSEKNSDRRSARTDDGSRSGGTESFADSVFWDVMLDSAIKMAQTGMREREIARQLGHKGCPGELASVIAEKAFNIHAHYVSNSSSKNRNGFDNTEYSGFEDLSGETSFKRERQDSELHRAFIGRWNFLLGPRDTIDYYLRIFAGFTRSSTLNPFKSMNINKRLLKLLVFSMILCTAIFIAIDLVPGDSGINWFSDRVLLQLPLLLLPLMFAWTLYRKLWTLTMAGVLVFLVGLTLFNLYVPQLRYHDFNAVMIILAICYAPFVLMVLFGDYIYFRKARWLINRAGRLFDEHQDRVIWVGNKGGTSGLSAFVYILVLVSALTFLVPRNQEVLAALKLDLPVMTGLDRESAEQIARRKLMQAEESFELGESHFNRSPPDYQAAAQAFRRSAENGSVLAAYKLGYMYYVGQGLEQNDSLAFDYFSLATRAPLAFQPHSLEITTRYLAESFNNLGVMYQSGYGAKKNRSKAYDMFKKAADFGSYNGQQNLGTVYATGAFIGRKPVMKPVFR